MEAPEDQLGLLEQEWIKKLRLEGYPLTNGTDGGEGISGWKHSAETKRKMSEAAKRRPPISEETREKRRQSMQGQKWSAETNARRSDSLKGENVRTIICMAKQDHSTRCMEGSIPKNPNRK